MRKESKIHYTGLFIDFDYMWSKIGHITRGRYERVVKRPHITFLYKPDVSDYSLVGEEATVVVTGYGYDDENEGLSVRVETDNYKLLKLYNDIETPHITLTVAADGHTVNTKNVEFYPVPVIRMKAVYGIVDDSGELITE
ncbi:MAG: hypothetical protein J6D27_07560 [Ruminiclostridium sp.]|nr:hypothetical protein [Ruminiclostridium sp.]